MSCPYTSAQNGKAERMIRTTNDIMRSLLFQASVCNILKFTKLNRTLKPFLVVELDSSLNPEP
jgi:hypothetical protein